MIGAEEEIFEMNNGCICCTVRGDLIRILGSLMKRKDKFDYVMIETTGLADPGPVAQTFFVDDDLRTSSSSTASSPWWTSSMLLCTLESKRKYKSRLRSRTSFC